MKKRNIFVLALSFMAVLAFSPAAVRAHDEAELDDDEEIPSIDGEVKSKLTKEEIEKIANSKELIVPRFKINLS